LQLKNDYTLEIFNGNLGAARVPLVEGQSARGLRTAISRAATSLGLSVETLEGEGFVAVRKAEKPHVRKSTQASSEPGKRRGQPLKRQEQDSVTRLRSRHDRNWVAEAHLRVLSGHLCP
jgi:hypothetical protein